MLDRGLAGRAGAKGKREAELEVIGGRGEGPAVPTLGKRVEGTALVSICCLQLSQSLCHLTVSPPGAAAGLAALTTATIVAALSAAASFLIFLPAPDRAADGDGKQLPCPATSLLQAGAAEGAGRRV